MRVRDMLRAKGAHVETVEPERTVLEAMRRLVEAGIGSLVVLQDGRLAGIITERDVLRLGALDPDHLGRLTVAEAMTPNPIHGALDDDLRLVMDTMTRNRFRHLPILDDGQLVGMISIGDVVHAVLESTQTENEQLRAYIGGVVS
jgi:CBS domain-containing protein